LRAWALFVEVSWAGQEEETGVGVHGGTGDRGEDVICGVGDNLKVQLWITCKKWRLQKCRTCRIDKVGTGGIESTEQAASLILKSTSQYSRFHSNDQGQNCVQIGLAHLQSFLKVGNIEGQLLALELDMLNIGNS